jgi:hypothetical protein
MESIQKKSYSGSKIENVNTNSVVPAWGFQGQMQQIVVVIHDKA